MKPYYERDGITIYHGDCREVLPALPKVDAVVTDPPYGHGKKWSGGTWASDPMYDSDVPNQRHQPSSRQPCDGSAAHGAAAVGPFLL